MIYIYIYNTAVKKVLQEVTEANLLPSAVSVRGLMMAYHTSGDQDGMLQVQDYLEKTSCSPHQFDTNMLRVLQNSNAKPYLFSGSAGPGLWLARVRAFLV